MSIKSLRVQDFGRVVDIEIALGSATSLMGPNRSGKTTLVDALRFLVTGKPVRHDTLPEVVRQGAKVAQVEVFTDDGRGLMRTRTAANKGEQFVDGEPKDPASFAAAVKELLGATTEAIDLALGSDGLLSMSPEELQSFLVRLTGASLGQAAIAAALDDVDRNALKILRIPEPTSLGELGSAATRAVEARKTAKQTKAARLEDVGRIPMASDELEALAINTPAADIVEQIEELRRQQTEASFAQGEESGRHEVLQARAKELHKVPHIEPVDISGPQRKVNEAITNVARIERLLVDERRVLANDIEAAGEPVELPADAAGIDGRIEQAEAEKLEASQVLDRAKAEGEKLKKALEESRENCNGDCPTCRQKLSPEAVAGLESILELTRKRYSEIDAIVNDAEGTLTALIARREAIKDIQARIDAAARVAAGRNAVAGLEKELAQANSAKESAGQALKVAQDRKTAAQAWIDAQAELKKIDKVLSTSSAPVDPAAIEEKIEHWKRVQTAQVNANERARIRRLIATAEETITAANIVDKSCGPEGIRVRLIAAAVGPFLQPANEVLAELLPGTKVDVEDDGGLAFVVRSPGSSVRTYSLSDGETVLVTAALQIATARLSGAPIIAIDRAELVDEPKRQLLKTVAARQCSAGLQVLFLSCNAPPATVRPGAHAYVINEGRAVRVSQMEAA